VTTLEHQTAHYGLGLTLGNAEVRLEELVAAYAMLARGGERIAPIATLDIDGRETPRPPTERVISTRSAFWIADILSDAEARAYVFGRGGSLEFPFPVAAKTGTSQSYFDNWVIGYTPEVTVGVWVGNFDRTPLRNSSGVTGAGPIFHAVMLAAVERQLGTVPIGRTEPIVPPTGDLRRAELCAVSGEIATAACPTRVSEWLPVSGTSACTWHHATDRGLVTVWPASLREWARDAGLADEHSPSEQTIVARPDKRESSHGDERLSILKPLGGAVFLIDPTLRPEFQTLSLAARGGRGRLTWYVDRELVGTSGDSDAVRWPIRRGRHDIVVRDDTGATATAFFDVR
jgi:penicillin-binding protein 1C